MPCLEPSLEQDGNLGPTPLGLETAAPCQPRAALAVEGRKDAGISRIGRFRRCTGRLNATQPGVLTVSTQYIRGLAAFCKGSVAVRQHSTLFAETVLSYD